MDSGIFHGRSHHTVDHSLPGIIRSITNGVDLIVLLHVIVGKNLIPQHLRVRINIKILVIFIKPFVIFITFQISEHGRIPHIMTVNNGMIIRKIRLIHSFQENTSGNMIISIDVTAQIRFIISGIQHRITDVDIVIIIETQPCHNIRIFLAQCLKLNAGSVLPKCPGAIRMHHIFRFQCLECLF